jgi:hypothetical protein
MDIKLLSRKEIKEEFKILIEDAILIKGSVAFWTWDANYIENNFGKSFFKALKNPESFFCIDISTPITNIENILKCWNKADNFFVFSYKFKSGKGIPLLHSKITYIECKDSYNIILGSHNNTGKAFDGINLEHSIHIKFSKKLNNDERVILDKLLSELEKIKSLCLKFNPNNISYYKSLYKKPISIFLKFNSQQINNIQNNSTISIISLDLVGYKKDDYKNIYGKDVLLFVYDYQKKLVKYYLAEGEADDKVGQYEMEEKVTTSDFIALKIVRVLDHLGLAYPFYGNKNKIIKGKVLNFMNHMIQRVKIIRELSHNEILLNSDIDNLQNIYKEINLEDLHLLDIDESEKNNIIKIDPLKYNSEVKKDDGVLPSFNIEENFNSNTTAEIEANIYDKVDKIFALLFSENYEVSEIGISNQNNHKLNNILKILTGETFEDLINPFEDFSLNEKTKKLQVSANNIINNSIIDKKDKNKLGQFQSNFSLKV